MDILNPLPTSDEFSQNKILQTLLYFFTFIALCYLSVSYDYTLEILARNADEIYADVSTMFAVFSVGGLLGTLIAGQFYDRQNPHAVLAIFVLATIAFNSIIPLVPYHGTFLVVLFLLGLSQSGVLIGVIILMVWVHGRLFAPFMLTFYLCSGISNFLYQRILEYVLAFNSQINWIFWLMSLLLLPTILLTILIKSPLSALQQAEAETSKKKPGNTRLIVLLIVIITLSEVRPIYIQWLVLLHNELPSLNFMMMSTLFSLFSQASLIACMVAIPVAVFIKPRYMLPVMVVGAILSLLIVIGLPTAFPALLVGTFGLSFWLAAFFPVALSLAARQIPLTGQQISLLYLSSLFGATIFPWASNQSAIFQESRILLFGIMTSLVLLLCICIWLAFFRLKDKIPSTSQPEVELL